jgi:hypothetical protein
MLGMRLEYVGCIGEVQSIYKILVGQFCWKEVMSVRLNDLSLQLLSGMKFGIQFTLKVVTTYMDLLTV